MSKSDLSLTKKILVFLGSVILASVSGCLLSGFWAQGGNVFWKPIDYFPLPVESVLLMEPFGSEIWVRSNKSEIFHIVYPCESGQACWNKIEVLPEVGFKNSDYRVTENTCDNDSIAYPLFHKIKSCITSVVPNESPWIVSLALTEDNRLWIWQKPWDSPYNVLAYMAFSIFGGAIIGLLIGTFWAWKIK